jgi:predicted phosphodiesterase
MNLRPRINKVESSYLQDRRKFLKSRDEEITIVIGCAHLPFQNRTLMDGIKKLAADLSIDRLIWLGDALDCNALGHFERGMLSSTGITLEDEYNDANKELDDWDKILRPDASKVFMFGNHENRYFRWQKSPDNAKYGGLLSPITALELDERHYNVIDDYRDGVYKIADLDLFHGDLTNIHVAKKSLDTYRKSTMFAHTHRVQVYKEGAFASYNIGTAANLNAPCFDYMPRSTKERWANGFGIVIKIDGIACPQAVEVTNDHFYYGGYRY